MVRQIRIVLVIALVRMMFQMINTKPHRAGCEVWEIGDDRHHFVPAWVPENQIMCCVMNDDVIGMISERADAKGNNETEPPVTESKRAHPVCNRCLQDNNRYSNQRSPRIAHHQLANFRMRLNRFRLVKRGLHRPPSYCIAAESSNALFQFRAAEQRQYE